MPKPSRPSRPAAHFAATLLVSLLSLWLIGCERESDSSSASQQAEKQAVPVEVVTLKTQTVTLTTELPARVMPFRISQVRPQVDGIVTERLLKQGLEVEAGQPLYQIDPSRYQAAVSNAEAELKKAKANLAAVKITARRYENLVGTSAVSQQQYDDVQAQLQQREAEVAVAEAELEQAQVDLQYTRVTAPISGRIEQFMVTEGALLEALQDQSLATIRQLDPIYIDMTQAASDLQRMRRQIDSGAIKAPQPRSVRVILEDGTPYPHSGEVMYAEMNTSPSTGTVLIRVGIPNPDRWLIPGQFVRAVVDEGIMDNALLVPQRAVSFNRNGEAQVMRLNNDNTVATQSVELGRAIDTNWLVKSGLNAGDQVVVAGLQKIRSGSLVSPSPADTDPSPSE